MSDANDPPSILDRWNEAHRRHDTQALGALYGAKVSFYGARLSGAECAARKETAFASASDYSQSIAGTRFVPDGNGGTYVEFTKTWTSHGRSTATPGYVYVDGGRIIAEGDGQSGPTVRWDWCIVAVPLDTPDAIGLPGNEPLADYKVSALDAVQSTMRSQHARDVGVRAHALRLKVVVKGCPYLCSGLPDGPCSKPCDPKVSRCEPYKLGIQNADTSTTLEDVEVDAVTKVLYWQPSGSEPLR